MNRQEAIAEAKKLGYKWVAMDSSGIWWGYENKPFILEEEGLWYSDELKYELLGAEIDGWQDSLTEVYSEYMSTESRD